MAIIKCVMCGGDLEIIEGARTAECEYCGCCQTISRGIDGQRDQQWILDLEALLRRGELLLEDGEWGKACGYFEKVLDRSPECAQAYLGMLLARRRVRSVEELSQQPKPFGDDPNYLKVLRFGEPWLVSQLQEALVASAEAEQSIREAKEQAVAERQRLKEEKAQQERQQKEERQRLARQQKEERQRKEAILKAAVRKQRQINQKFANLGWILYGAVTLLNTIIFFLISTEHHYKISYLLLVLIFGVLALGYLCSALRLRAKASASRSQKAFLILTVICGSLALLVTLLVTFLASSIIALVSRILLLLSVIALVVAAILLPLGGGEYQKPE